METIPIIGRAEFDRGGDVSRRQPCLIADGLSACDRWRRWTPEHLAEVCGDVRISVEVSFDGAAWRPSLKGMYRFPQVALRDAVRWIRTAQDDCLYYAPQEPIEKLGPLAKDVTFGRPCSEGRTEMWLGSGNSISALHWERSPYFFGQVYGEKRFILYSPDQVRALYPHPQNPHISSVNLQQPDLESYPRFAEATATVVTVRAGEVLYMPSFWWHHVTSLSVSISVTHSWTSDLREYCNPTATRLMTKEYLRDGWADQMRNYDLQLTDLLALAKEAAGVEQRMATLAMCVLLDHYDRWPDHDTGAPAVESDVREGIERLKHAALRPDVSVIDREFVVALARRVSDESVLGAFARATTAPGVSRLHAVTSSRS